MILDEIVAEKQKEIAKLKKVNNSLKKELQKDNLSIIAEIKKASPSKGIIASTFNPEQQLKEYEKGGAAGISVLTDNTYFQGSNQILKNVRSRTELPILRKDFILDEIQIYESLIIGADVILLIANILSENKLNKLLNLTHTLGLEAIVEVHSHQDLKKIKNTSTEIIGINNRNLEDFTVDLKTTANLVNELNDCNLRKEYYIISESGISNKEDISYLKNLGIDGVLIGETLMKAENPSHKIRKFLKED